jgi:hypothetical protein
LTRDGELAAMGLLVGAVVGLVSSHVVGKRVAGVAPSVKDQSGRPSASMRRSGTALLGPWVQLTTCLGVAIGLLVSRSIGGAALGATAGATLGLVGLLLWALRSGPQPEAPSSTRDKR